MKKKLKGICYPREKVRKTLLMTKLSLILMFFCLQIQANGFSQHTRVSIKLDNVSVKQLFIEIEKLTDLAFVYNANDLDQLGVVNVNFTNEEIDKILDYCLSGKGVNYSFVNNHIVIRKSETAAPQQKQRVITGKVIDKNTGEPLPGATIKITGTSIGTAADIDGNFQLNIATEIPALEVSFIGYKVTEVPVGKREHVEVLLEPEIAQMAEVVVTGIFTRKAESYTGAARTMKAEELAKVGNTNVLQALKNLDPSFQVLESNDFGSDPNHMPEIQMRGSSSFSDMKDKYQTNPNQPLFIVDGFEQSIDKVMDMDMNRVESVTLLKDATAKALYGSKGANGVVVIETKRPDVGRLKVSYTGSVDIQAPDLSSYNLANAYEKLEIEKNAGMYTSSTNNPIDQQNKDEAYNILKKEVERGVDTYWLSKPLRTGVGHKHSLNFEGGDQYIRYNISVNYNDVKGVMKGSDRKTYGGDFTFSYRYKSLLFREQLSILHNQAENSPYGSFSEYAKLNPYWRPYNEDGTVKEILGYYDISNSQGTHPIYNPLINATINTQDISKYTDITNNFYVEWNMLKDLKATGRLGVTSRTNESDLFYPRDHTSFRKENMSDEEYFKRGLYTKENGKSTNINTDIALNYSKTWDKHVLFANGQWSMSQNKSESVAVKAEGFANDKMDYITHALQYQEGGRPSGSESLSRETSVLASINYSYDMRYLLDANYRANASSLFGSDNRWGHFWSVGIGWNVHNEKFLREKHWLQQMKLRASTGYTGSQNFNSYQAMSTYRYYSDEVYDNIIGSYLISLANRDLQWQKTQDNNIGIDLTVFNILDVSFDYYVKNTKNLLTPVTLPPSVGFNSYVENLGSSQNKGMEARVNIRAVSRSEEDIHLNVFASLMSNTNKIKKINDALSAINSEKDSDKNMNADHENDKSATTKPSVRYQEGQSMDAIWAVRSLGIDPGTGKELYLTKDGEMTYTWDADDQVVCGDALPKVTGTFGFNFDWRGFSVNTSFYYRLGGQMYNQTLVDKVEDADLQYNVDKRVYSGRWTTPGQQAEFKKLSYPNYFTRPTSRFVQDLSELQMTSLNVGYDFRNCKFMKHSSVERLKVSFYMNDVFRASTVKTERGTDYPFARSFSFQLQATF